MLRLLCLSTICLAIWSTTTHAQTLLLSDAGRPSLSPDASEVVCSSEAGVLRVSVWDTDLDTLVQSSVLEDNATPIWHPTEQSIIYLHRQFISPPFDWEIAVYDLVGGSTISSWPAPGLWDDFGISFYADSSEVLFDDSNNQVWAMDIRDGSTRFVLSGLNASVSPDGQWIAYLSNLADRRVVVEPIGGGQADTIGTGGWVIWTSDSQYILYADSEFNLIQVSRDGSSSRPIMTGDDWFVAGSHAQSTLAYTLCDSETGSCGVWTTGLPTGIPPYDPHRESGLTILPNVPNPFGRGTLLQFELLSTEEVEIEIFDVRGRRVFRALLGRTGPGQNEYFFGGKDETGRLLPSGVYFTRLSTNAGTAMRRMVIIR